VLPKVGMHINGLNGFHRHKYLQFAGRERAQTNWPARMAESGQEGARVIHVP